MELFLAQLPPILQSNLSCKPVNGENQHMVGINRAGTSGAYFGGRTESEPARARDSSSASPSNSPQVPPTSTVPAGRERLLQRSTALSSRIRKELEQSFPTAEEARARNRQQANSIVHGLVESGADLNHFHTMLKSAMDNHAVAFSRVEHGILLQHFPNMVTAGIRSDSVLANELCQAVRKAVRAGRYS
ncbi:hypothetical protein ALO43_200351 [Pseudomonas tremae]|uniref:Betaine-aldehyde dehydrogenase n=1 Tax=Pseudomonas tremae TaxID=200454 RepID=A0AA40TV78_9PSED|nr:hypothetical protein ALO43_200351 [Pseudomonas tremae]